MRPQPGTSVLYRTMRILEGANLFFLLAMMLVAALFVLGNFQEFLDSSQLWLLGVLSFVSVLCVASGLTYIVALLVWMVRRRHLMILRFLYAIVATMIGAFVVLSGGALAAIVAPA